MISRCRLLELVTKRLPSVLLLTLSIVSSTVPATAQTAQADSKSAAKTVAKGSSTAEPSPGGTPAASGRPTVIELGAVWCAPCKKLAPIFERSKAAYAAKADFRSLDVDTPEGTAFAQKYNATGVPVVVILDAGGKAVYNHAGLIDQAKLNAEISKVVH